MKDYDKNKESFYLKYWDVNNLYGWAVSQKFRWTNDTFQFNENHIKNYNKKRDDRYLRQTIKNETSKS